MKHDIFFFLLLGFLSLSVHLFQGCKPPGGSLERSSVNSSSASEDPIEAIKKANIEKIKKVAKAKEAEGDAISEIPHFSVETGSEGTPNIVFIQSPETEHQTHLSKQGSPQKGDGLNLTSFSLVDDGTANDSSKGVSTGNFFDFSDRWGIGTEWFGTAFSYRLGADNIGNAIASAEIEATIFKQQGTILGAKLQTSRDYADPAVVGGSRLSYFAEGILIEQTTRIAEGSLLLGQSIRLDDKQVTQTLGEYNWQYAVGAIPVLVTTRFVGSMGTGGPYAEFSLAPDTNDEVITRLYVRPWAKLDAVAEGSLLTALPKKLRLISAGAGAELTFLRGSFMPQIYAVSTNPEPCFRSEFLDFRTLAGRVYAFVNLSLAAELVGSVIDTICSNDYISIPGCNYAQGAIGSITDLLTFNQVFELFNYPGFDLGADYVWFDGQGCKQKR